MKTIFITLFALILASTAYATPKMWIKDQNGRVPLSMDTLTADITISADLVETVFTMRFVNKTSRMQEGEFVLPLPDGATISNYALEVKGALREAVAVEKQQARHAYESIKRQMIDPGLVEREQNNTYRTRVFPIPANGTKLIRIGYIEQLSNEGDKFQYQLPTSFPGPIDRVTYRVKYNKDITPNIHSSEIQFLEKPETTYIATARNKQLKNPIKIDWQIPTRNTLISEASEKLTTHHLITKVPAQLEFKKSQHPENIHIIWDASASCHDRDPIKEFELLDLYFKEVKNASITLEILRNQIVDKGVYELKDGNWEKLQLTLKNIHYDGSSNFDLIEKSRINAEFNILFTDGKGSELIKTRKGQTIHVIHRSKDFRVPTNEASIGLCINLEKPSPKQAVQNLTHSYHTLRGVIHNGDYQDLPAKMIEGGRPLSITFRNKHRKNRSLQLVYTNKTGKEKKFTVITDNLTSSTNLLTRHWAQCELKHLEVTCSSTASIIKHCREYKLVSDYTSLIVLERFKDYVIYDIPPPEPELEEKWRIARRKIKKPKKHNYLHSVIAARKSHEERDFSWVATGLTASYKQASIWLEAIDKAFDPTDVDQTAIGKIENWKKRTDEIVKDQKHVKSKKALVTWINKYDTLIKEWNSFQELKPHQPADQPVAVSIRGLVNDPNTYRVKPPFTLKQAIPHAGGLHPKASPMHVSLYRSGHATTYNIASSRFKDIPLLRGDMIVVEPEPYYHGWGGSPFDDDSGDEDTPDYSKEPAITNRTPRVTSDNLDDDASAGGGTPFSNRRQPSNTSSNPTQNTNTPPDLTETDWETFAKNISTAEDAQKPYLKLLGHHPRKDAFYARAAKILTERRQRKLAQQVISNIRELHTGDPAEGMRKLVYHLTHLGYHKEANELIKTMIELKRANNSDHLLLAHSYAQLRDTTGGIKALSMLRSEAFSYKKANDLGIAHADSVSLKRKTEKDYWKKIDKIETRFLRCVFYSSNSSPLPTIEVKEPVGNSTTSSRISSQGGIMRSGEHLQEYMIKNPIPGDYQFLYQAPQPTTILAVIYKDWGTTQQSVSYHIVNTKNDQPTHFFESNVAFLKLSSE